MSAARARRLVRLSVVGACLLLLGASCQSGLYSWGPYEDGAYHLCTDFVDESPVEVLAELDEHISELRDRDRAPAPGMHAQAGYLEYLVGNRDAAVRHFEAEKSLYPESTVFIDGLLRRMAQP